MRYLSLGEVLSLHDRLVRRWGGPPGVRDLGALESAIAQPRMTFDGKELYPDLASKAAALGYSLIMNHPFLDGNKRVGHAALETFLLLNGLELQAAVDEAETMVLGVAGGQRSRDDLVTWIRQRIVPRPG